MFANRSYKNLFLLRKRPATTPDIEAGGGEASTSSSSLTLGENSRPSHNKHTWSHQREARLCHRLLRPSLAAGMPGLR